MAATYHKLTHTETDELGDTTTVIDVVYKRDVDADTGFVETWKVTPTSYSHHTQVYLEDPLLNPTLEEATESDFQDAVDAFAETAPYWTTITP